MKKFPSTAVLVGAILASMIRHQIKSPTLYLKACVNASNRAKAFGRQVYQETPIKHVRLSEYVSHSANTHISTMYSSNAIPLNRVLLTQQVQVMTRRRPAVGVR